MVEPPPPPPKEEESIIERTKKAFAPPTKKQLEQQARAKAKGGLTSRGISRFEGLTPEQQEAELQKARKQVGTTTTQDKITSSRIIEDKNIKINVRQSGLTEINRLDSGEQFLIQQSGKIVQAQNVAIPELGIKKVQLKKEKELSFLEDSPLARKVSIAPVDKSGLPISTRIKEGFFIGTGTPEKKIKLKIPLRKLERKDINVIEVDPIQFSTVKRLEEGIKLISSKLFVKTRGFIEGNIKALEMERQKLLLKQQREGLSLKDRLFRTSIGFVEPFFQLGLLVKKTPSALKTFALSSKELITKSPSKKLETIFQTIEGVKKETELTKQSIREGPIPKIVQLGREIKKEPEIFIGSTLGTTAGFIVAGSIAKAIPKVGKKVTLITKPLIKQKKGTLGGGGRFGGANLGGVKKKKKLLLQTISPTEERIIEVTLKDVRPAPKLSLKRFFKDIRIKQKEVLKTFKTERRIKKIRLEDEQIFSQSLGLTQEFPKIPAQINPFLKPVYVLKQTPKIKPKILPTPKQRQLIIPFLKSSQKEEQQFSLVIPQTSKSTQIFKTSQPDFQVSKSDNLLTTKQDIKELSLIDTTQDTLLKVSLIPEQTTKTSQIPETRLVPELVQETRLAPEVLTEVKQVKRIINPFTIGTTPRVPKVPPAPKFFPGLGKDIDQVKGFNVLVRSKGKDIKVNKKPLTEIGAENLGYDITDNTVSASFQTPPSKRKAKAQFFEVRSDKKNKFRKKGKRFIEKETYRIDSAGEFQGITVKGRLARSKNKRNPFL